MKAKATESSEYVFVTKESEQLDDGNYTIASTIYLTRHEIAVLAAEFPTKEKQE
jgi:hypothetical protein